MNQYFNLFELNPSFDLDIDALEETYRHLAIRFHPDKFAFASSFEQKQAMMVASTLNEAYRILKDPIDRAAYLLKQHDIDADTPEHTSFAPEFLMRQLEWREALEAANNDNESLQKLFEEIKTEQNKLYQQLQQAFLKREYNNAANLVRQGRFLNKLQQEIKSSQL